MVLLVLAALCLLALTTDSSYSRASSSINSEQIATNTVVLGTTVSTSKSLPQVIFKGPFTVLSTTGTNLPCEFWASNFTAALGDYVSGNFTSDNPVNFFVVQQTKYEDWLKAGTCGTPEDAITSQLITTSYSFDAALPNPGSWLIVLVNTSNAKNADGYLVAYLSTLGYTVTELMTSTIIPTIMRSTTTTTAQPTSIVSFQFAPVIAILGIVVGTAVGLGAILMVSRRRRTENNTGTSGKRSVYAAAGC